MAKSNRTTVGEALELLAQGLYPFVERELRAVHKDKWQAEASQSISDRTSKKGNIDWRDINNILTVMMGQWHSVFNKTLGHSERSLVSELKEVRNDWAHQKQFSTDDTYRALDSMARLLSSVSAEEAKEIEKQKNVLLRSKFDEQRRAEMRKVTLTEGAPSSGLKPWREVATPHKDVASGDYQQAEFAADLWQVYRGEAASEYQHPAEFFRRTYITGGLHELLVNAVKRLGSGGGDPVVELQTNFGGGKTHSMLALYHLFSGTPVSDLPGTEPILEEAGCPIAPKVKRAVLVGTKISPGNPSKKSDGTLVRTLWGEIAWQLGGKAGYAMVRADDENATNPGDTLREVFNKFSPCIILIDEWVAYARQLHDGTTLPAGTFDTQFTFAQTLSESAKAAKNTLLIVSIPASDNEIGGEFGTKALARLKNAIGRVRSSWTPANQDEGFEIVRRRLFEPMLDQQAFVARDTVARAFVEMYGSQHNEFPTGCREAEYERRIKLAYPIHPELFDRLYTEWSTLDKFQRTRGVLRLMAAVIHSLWKRHDSNLLILPSTIPIDDPAIQSELTQYLDDQWTPIINDDVDGENSLPLKIDKEVTNLGRYSACRRVARTIYIGSAPGQRTANRGIDERSVKLGCVQPGEVVATFGDAIRRLTDRATFLYEDGTRYWYSVQPTVRRLAEGRAAQYPEHDVHDKLVEWLKQESSPRGDFARVHVNIPSSDIPDNKEARLVILGPEYPHSKGQVDSPARKEIQHILNQRGKTPRLYKNSLVFLVGDATRLNDSLLPAIRTAMAWESIATDRKGLNLNEFQFQQAQGQWKNAENTVKARIPEAYQWLLIPEQSEPQGRVEWVEIRYQSNETLVLGISKKLKNDERVLVQMGGIRLRFELDRIPLWRDGSVSVKQLVEDFASYLYLPRLSNPEDVLLAAVREGVCSLTWELETFAYAERKDENGGFAGLVAGKSATIRCDSSSVVVQSEMAKKQFDEQAITDPPQPGGSGTKPEIGGDPTHLLPPSPALPKNTRFYMSAPLNTTRIGRDVQKFVEEVISNLTSAEGAQVEVTLEVNATTPDGFSQQVVRTVFENCQTLRVSSFGFDE